MENSYYQQGKANPLHSPPKFIRKTLKFSPFKAANRKHQALDRQSLQPARKQRINDQNRQTYDRFNKEDKKTKKEIVEQKKDSMILKFFKRKEGEE